jgi:uncharacterized protein (TIGR02145 family)
LPGGTYSYLFGGFYDAGNYGYWWTATENDSGNAYSRYMGYYYDYVNEYWGTEYNGVSVRCVRD